MNILKALKGMFRKEALPTGVYHNYTKQAKCWGHSISSTKARNGDYSFLHILGHSKGLIRKGDYIVFGELFGQGHRYQVDAVKYFDNPKDMFEADLSLAKRKDVADGERYDQITDGWEEAYKNGKVIYTSRNDEEGDKMRGQLLKAQEEE